MRKRHFGDPERDVDIRFPRRIEILGRDIQD